LARGLQQNVSLVGNVTSTWLEGHHILDLEGAARWTSPRFELEARAGGRAVGSGVLEDGTTENRLWAEASATMRIAPRFSFLVSGGSYPSDPVRRALGAKYASAGIRVAFGGADRSEPMTVPAQLLAAVRAHEKASTSPAARLEIVRTGEMHVLRVHAASANNIDVTGDFTDWEPRSMKKTGDGVWEIEISLPPGVHRLNIRIDEGEWLVPAGARPEQGDFGGMVGVVVIR
jgi:cytochrome c5